MNLDYLITGTGRCGTLFLARFLSSIGIPCGHESIFTTAGFDFAEQVILGERPSRSSVVSRTETKWILPETICAESSYLSAPFLQHELLANTQIIHLVRKPIDVINSFIFTFNYFSGNQLIEKSDPYQKFIYHYVPELTKRMNQASRTALYYIKWNEMIEQSQPAFRFRVEDSPSRLADFLGIELPTEYYHTKCNQLKNYKPTISMKDISPDIRPKLTAVARKYYSRKQF